MKKIIILTFLFFYTISLAHAEQCDSEFHIYYELKTLNELHPLELSKYQYPDFKEDDFLTLWKLLIINEGNCTSGEMILKMNISSPKETLDHLFCNYQIVVPALSKGEVYSIVPTSIKEDKFDGWSIKRYHFIDSKGKDFIFCTPSLRDAGLWSVSLEFRAIDLNSFNYLRSWGYSRINEKNEQISNSFKVIDKSVIKNQELQEKSIWSSGFFTILGAILGFVLIMGFEKIKMLRQRKSAIKALIHEMNQNIGFAERILKRKKIYSEGKEVPFHNLISINLEKVLTGEYISDSNLINRLFDYYLSTTNFNNLLIRMRSPNIPKGTTDLQKVVRNMPQYKKLLNKLIKDLEKEVKK